MKKFIHISTADRKFFRDTFGVTDMTIWNAVNFASDTDICRKIRKVAMEQRGGILMVTAPAVETLHDADGHIVQYFPNGASIDIDRATNTAVVTYKGSEEKTFKKVTLANMTNIQDYARAL